MDGGVERLSLVLRKKNPRTGTLFACARVYFEEIGIVITSRILPAEEGGYGLWNRGVGSAQFGRLLRRAPTDWEAVSVLNGAELNVAIVCHRELAL